MAISWGAVPAPSCPLPSIRVFSVKGGQKPFCRLLAQPVTVLVHWLGGRSVPHDNERCAHCGTHPLRWKGYAACEIYGVTPQGAAQGWHRWILEVTEHCAQQLAVIELGQTFELSRPGRRPNGPVYCRIDPRPVKEKPSAPFDVVPHLLRLWGLSHQASVSLTVQADDASVQPLAQSSACRKEVG